MVKLDISKRVLRNSSSPLDIELQTISSLYQVPLLRAGYLQPEYRTGLYIQIQVERKIQTVIHSNPIKMGLIPLRLRVSSEKLGEEYSNPISSNPPIKSTARRRRQGPVTDLIIRPYTQREWTKVMEEVKHIYTKRQYKQCSARCIQLLDNVKDPVCRVAQTLNHFGNNLIDRSTESTLYIRFTSLSMLRRPSSSWRALYMSIQAAKFHFSNNLSPTMQRQNRAWNMQPSRQIPQSFRPLDAVRHPSHPVSAPLLTRYSPNLPPRHYHHQQTQSVSFLPKWTRSPRATQCYHPFLRARPNKSSPLLPSASKKRSLSRPWSPPPPPKQLETTLQYPTQTCSTRFPHRRAPHPIPLP